MKSNQESNGQRESDDGRWLTGYYSEPSAWMDILTLDFYFFYYFGYDGIITDCVDTVTQHHYCT